MYYIDLLFALFINTAVCREMTKPLFYPEDLRLYRTRTYHTGLYTSGLNSYICIYRQPGFLCKRKPGCLVKRN